MRTASLWHCSDLLARHDYFRFRMHCRRDALGESPASGCPQLARSGPPAMSAFMPLLGDKRTSATSPVEPALRDLIHARAYLVVGVGELAGILQLADHRPVVGADRVRLASAIRGCG